MKLWQAAKIQGHRNPFGKPLIEYTMVELDFVLEMAALDDPDKWTFQRIGHAPAVASKSLASWTSRLAGKALTRFMLRTGIARANKGVAAWEARRSMGGRLRPGLSRQGKRVDDASDKN